MTSQATTATIIIIIIIIVSCDEFIAQTTYASHTHTHTSGEERGEKKIIMKYVSKFYGGNVVCFLDFV